MVEHDIADHLADDELRFIGEELSRVEYNNLPVEEQARSRAFADAWANAARANAASGNGGESEEEECSNEERKGMMIGDLERRRAENSLKTTGEEERMREEEDEGDSSEEETLQTMRVIYLLRHKGGDMVLN